MIRVCGLDEVGRGAYAGPIVAAAVVIRGRVAGLLENCPVPIRDSKTLSHSQRLQIAAYLVNKGVRYCIETISASDINDHGITWANREIFLRLIARIKATKYTVDGQIKFNVPDKRIESRVRADGKVLQVMLAGILAKLHRDKIMRRLDKQFPQYLWKQNKGYGTLAHRRAIAQVGPCEHHRHKWLD